MLASDSNNVDFERPFNPDSALTVQFFVKPVQNEFQTEQKQRPIWEDVVFVRIFTPGNSLNIVETPAREDHKRRFPMQWSHFTNTQGGDTREMGTPLAQWPLLTPSQVEELRGLKFFTVDAIAQASDQQIGNIGMIAGMNPLTLRAKAQRFLQAAHDTAVVNHAEEKAKQLETENSLIRDQLRDMQSQMQELMAAMPKKRKQKEDIEA